MTERSSKCSGAFWTARRTALRTRAGSNLHRIFWAGWRVRIVVARGAAASNVWLLCVNSSENLGVSLGDFHQLERPLRVRRVLIHHDSGRQEAHAGAARTADMKRAIVHVVGAGAAGMTAARALVASGRCDVVLHEASSRAGGRRRSFYDETLGLDIDTGNYPLLSAWTASLALIDALEARSEWREEAEAGIAFADFASSQRWRLKPNTGRCPWWLLAAKRRGPGLNFPDYWAARRLLSAPADATVASVVPAGAAMERLWRPMTLAALNSAPEQASARLAGGILRDLMRAGGAGLRILTPVESFGRAFVDPLARSLQRDGAAMRFERRLAALEFGPQRLAGMEFEHDRVDLGPRDALILATPWAIAAALIPGADAPSGASAALTVHYAAEPPPQAPAVLCAVNGPFDWLFTYRSRMSVTIKDAAARLDTAREALAAQCWWAVAAVTGLSDTLPAWRVVASRRAGCLSTPEENARRPACRTRWRNVFLAGGHVQSPLPDSLEAAVRSGEAAARAWLADAG